MLVEGFKLVACSSAFYMQCQVTAESQLYFFQKGEGPGLCIKVMHMAIFIEK
jgi:hypothetical protein